LSYAWGDPVFSEKIYLPSGYLAITSNLAAALRRLRPENGLRRLWVDAICINKSDDAEKGHQVMLMAQIYSSTIRTLAWLGEGNSEIHAAVDIIKNIASKAWQFGFSGLGTKLIMYPGSNGNLGALRELADQLDFQAINAFFAQAWFKRLWVVQEACLPPEVMIWNGPRSFNINDLFALQYVLLGMIIESEKANDGLDFKVSEAFLLSRKRNRYQLSKFSDENTEYEPIYVEIYLQRDRLCANAVDKIYGMLGLREIPDTIEIVVHYGSSVEGVYQDFASKYLQMGHLKLLHYSGRGLTNPSSSQASKLPTWAINWQSLLPLNPLDIVADFCAATKLPPSLHAEQGTFPFIQIVGVNIGIVEEDITTLAPESSSLTEIWRSNPKRLLSIEQKLTKSKQSYPTGEKINKAFARTLFLDNRTTLTTMFIGKEQDICELWTQFEQFISNNEVVGETVYSGAGPFSAIARSSSVHRNFFTTNTGYFGLGPRYTRPGDVVVIFNGDITPFVLRQIRPDRQLTNLNVEEKTKEIYSPDEQYELVGECYVHGLMDNEVVAPEWRAKEQSFWIR
jgi:Heterokaryon incompatibility protein (HET)